MIYALSCFLLGIVLAVWLIIGDVLAIQAILAHHASGFGKAALITALVTVTWPAIALIRWGPMGLLLDG